MNTDKRISYADLIKEYIAHKVITGYEPACTVEEIRRYLEFINLTMLDGAIQENTGTKIKQALASDSGKQKGFSLFYRDSAKPEVEVRDDGIILPTYALRYRVGDMAGRGRFIDYYLKCNCRKRELEDKSDEVDERIENFGYNVSATVLLKIWRAITRYYILENEWPRQCVDIKKYLLDMDLAKIIDLPPLSDELVELYFTFANRVMSLACEDNNLQLAHGSYQTVLRRANFDLAMSGFENYAMLLDDFIISLNNNTIARGTEVEPIAKPSVLKLVRELKEKEPNR